VTEHRKKIADYTRNPDLHDNKQILKNCDPKYRDKIIEGRIKALEKQLKKNEGELRKAQDQVKRLESEIKSLGLGLGKIGAMIAAPKSLEIDEDLQAGKEVSVGDVLKAAGLDLVGIVDPGILDILDWIQSDD
jgi:predicted nuclease with TOPRIM domain